MAAINSNFGLSSINRAQRTVNNRLKQIATGTKLFSAKENPSAYAISARMSARIGAVAQSNSNVQQGSAMLRTASGGVESTINALSGLQQRLIQAANDTNGDTDRAAIQSEVDQTISQIDENASIQYNGMNLIDGSRSSMSIVGVDGASNVMMGDMTSRGLGLTDSQGNSLIDVSNPAAINNSLDIVSGALNAAQGQSSAIDAALDEATTLGAKQQAMQFRADNYTTMEENLAASESTMGDTDIAKAVMELRSADTQQQLAMHATKLHMQNSASVLSLLQ